MRRVGVAREIKFYKRDKVFEIKTFGHLTAVDVDKKGRIICECSCGKKCTYQSGNLLEGDISCCGHTFGGFGSKNAVKTKYFDKLTVVKVLNKTEILCKCECGGETTTRPRNLFLRVTTSCDKCKDKRTETMKVADELVAKCHRKDMLSVTGVDKERTTRQKVFIFGTCDCGNIKSFELGGFYKLHYGSCGCYKPKILEPSPATAKVLEIKRFTRWTVDSWEGNDPRYVNCTCDCGNKKVIRADSLLNGESKSCTCLQRELTAKRFKGKFKADAVSRHELYRRYCSMLARCFSETNQDYHHYGGRGITVCPRWISPKRDITGFINFTSDMEEGYRKDLELERLDKDGNYSPENCKWVNRRSQVNNTSQNRELEGYGIVLNVAEWAELLKVSSKLIDDRINHCDWNDKTIEGILSLQFRDRKHHLLYKGKECTASEIWRLEGYTNGQRNNRCTLHGGMVEALQAEGIVFDVIKPRTKNYLTFEEGLNNLKNNCKTDYHSHLLYKIEEQLKGDLNDQT